MPDGEARKAFEADYNAMMESGMLPEDAESFEEILAQCAEIEKRGERRGLRLRVVLRHFTWDEQ